MDCPDKLETTTYMYSLLMEILYASSFAVIGLLINRLGKTLILCKFNIYVSILNLNRFYKNLCGGT